MELLLARHFDRELLSISVGPLVVFELVFYRFDHSFYSFLGYHDHSLGSAERPRFDHIDKYATCLTARKLELGY